MSVSVILYCPMKTLSAQKFASHNTSATYPSRTVRLNSFFYIERPPIEEQTVAEINKPGALIRIQAPEGMGKTSLLLRTLNYAVDRGYRTVTFNLAQIDCALLSDLDCFLRFLCASAAQQLHLDPKLDEYWDADVGSKVSCSLYFRCYLLEQVDSPIVLAFDELDWIFEYHDVARDVLALLRSWHEDARRTQIWQKLRIIVIHSTEIYIPLQLYQSPFNVGLHVQLKSFDLSQVENLAVKCQLNWKGISETKKLMGLVGGQPALIQLALCYLRQKEMKLAKLLETATNPEGIYYPHLCHQWSILQQEPELADSLRMLLQTNKPQHLKPIVAYKLIGMGLIKQICDESVVSCEIYRRYFTESFS